MSLSKTDVVLGALLFMTTTSVVTQLPSSAADERIAVIASAPRANPDLNKSKIDFPAQTRQAQEVKMRRNFDKKPASQDKIVRTHSKSTDRVLILGTDDAAALAM